MIEDKLLSMNGAVERLDLTELCIKSPAATKIKADTNQQQISAHRYWR